MKKLTAEQFRDIIQVFEDVGYEPESYSGRGMCGLRCLSVTCDNPCKAVLEITEECIGKQDCDEDFSATDFIRSLGTPRTDSMGRSQVLYFPNIVWQDEALDEDESEEE